MLIFLHNRMASKKIKNIASIVDYFDFLIKRAAPLDDVIITPYSEYGSDTTRLTDSRRSRKKSDYIMSLPSIEEFKSHYQYTNVKYRIIYSEKIFGLKSGKPIALTEYEEKIKSIINSKELEEDTVKEGKFLLQNFNDIFKPDAINIIANKFESSDLTGPKGIDHDLGHAILDKYENLFKADNFIKAINDDYEVKKISDLGEILTVPFDDYLYNYQRAAFVILTTIIANSNIIKGSVSEMNLKNENLIDFLSDLLVLYNQSGESLENINLKGVTLYANNALSKLSIYEKDSFNYTLKPRNEDIPNIRRELVKIFGEVEKDIKQYLDWLVGKVIVLW